MKYIYVIVIISIIASSCNGKKYNYAEAVKKDTERIFKDKKSFLQSLSFTGKINKKEKCENCNINKFTLFIEIEEIGQNITFQNEQYPPYYSFNDKLLSLTVTLQVFEKLREGDLITKKPNSRYLEFNDKRLEILHDKELIWLP